MIFRDCRDCNAYKNREVGAGETIIIEEREEHVDF